MSDLLNQIWVRVSNALYREQGQAMTEYAVVLVLLALIAGAIAASGIGTSIIGKITSKLSAI